jgi:hypothetical protein
MMRPFVVMPAGLPDGAARPGQEHGGPAGAATMTAADAALADHAARLAANADQVALCLDFDGTLSPIVPNPEATPAPLAQADLVVEGPPGLRELLRRLAS